MTFPIRPALLSMVVLAQMCSCTGRVPASSAPDPLITKVETGLSGRVHVVGEPIDAWSLPDRMAFYKVPGVSIAVLKDGKIIWAKGYGVLEGGKETPVDAD